MAPAVQAPVDKPQEDDVSVSEGPSHINFLVADDSNNSSGSDDEGPAQNGYELLPQDIGENGTDHDLHQDEETINASLSSERNPSTTMIEVGESSNCHPMDKDHIEKIKECMSGFTLPSSSVPSWASVIPEEDWKTYLLGRLEERKLDLKAFSQH
ncbi:male-enhanced antigen 1-like isoform X2 [Limulus polyphemus]|nr:male-enhanced antigen 1-like isoform X2 [Limulus polyphemus]XP_013785391.1 male-enhanced antigen 1-like isoform X2 [Limulus polyphemus]XP_013785392.1 male-enhanced antigen 1-like isoform X2 [Limulus polyphemus]XP_022253666.1 male-enhanced antigen 1-like isoform X2 [Limulus polyphemus]XP_022253668.1 male-enhanced antigen 1-like isoform X2 [Limulus polyphemus]XP_022253669.1 male-enhanced antigen 1-like isoform X2 [Limulus polyphemus]